MHHSSVGFFLSFFLITFYRSGVLHTFTDTSRNCPNWTYLIIPDREQSTAELTSPVINPVLSYFLSFVISAHWSTKHKTHTNTPVVRNLNCCPKCQTQNCCWSCSCYPIGCFYLPLSFTTALYTHTLWHLYLTIYLTTLTATDLTGYGRHFFFFFFLVYLFMFSFALLLLVLRQIYLSVAVASVLLFHLTGSRCESPCTCSFMPLCRCRPFLSFSFSLFHSLTVSFSFYIFVSSAKKPHANKSVVLVVELLMTSQKYIVNI